MKNDRTFYTPEHYAQSQRRKMETARGRLMIASCCSGSQLSTQIVERYNQLLRKADSNETIQYLDNIDHRFSDSETTVRLNEHVSGYDVFLVQSLYNPESRQSVDQNYMAFLIAARTFRENGARHVTGVLPYLAYARQDKPTKFMREPTTAKLMADLSISTGIDRMISWHPHSDQLHGFYSATPVNLMDPLALFVEEFKKYSNRNDVIAVAPDAGASKFVINLGNAMNIPSAIASKVRPEPEKVITRNIIGNFSGKRTALILDDMISSGGTIYSLAEKLVKEKNIQEITIGVSHNLCSVSALEKMNDLYQNYNLKQLMVTDSIPQTKDFKELPYIKIKSLADTLSRTINRIHYNRSVSQVFYNELKKL